MNTAALLAACAAAALSAAALPGQASAQAQDGGVEVRYAAARMVVIPEARSDVQVTVQHGRNSLPQPTVGHDGGVIYVDGGLGDRVGLFGIHMGLSCRGPVDPQRVFVPGHGEIALADLPLITAHVPLNANVRVGDAVFGEVGPTSSLQFANHGCGDWRIADVRGPLRIAESGSGDLRGGSAGGGAKIDVSGSSDVYLGPVNGRLETRVAGSGDIHLVSINGPILSRIAGSGDVTISGGNAPDVDLTVAGSGDFRLHGTAGTVNVRVAGSGDVDIDHATGPVSKHIAGSGDVNIGR